MPPYPPNGYCRGPQGGNAVPGSKCIVKLPKARYKGGTEFYGNLPVRNASFAWSEICATPEPEASLAPVPQVPMKQWYNTYVYVPERSTHRERQFLERYVQGPDGEWLDVVKARRMSNFYEQQRMQNLKEKMERAMIMTGSAVQKTQYTDAYSGEHLVACGGELLPKQVLYDEYNIHSRSAQMKEMLEQTREDMDFDNFRIAWPFGSPHRNKKIHPATYEWFDRRNGAISSDKSFQIIEMPSTYVDRETYDSMYSTEHKYQDAYQDARAMLQSRRM